MCGTFGLKAEVLRFQGEKRAVVVDGCWEPCSIILLYYDMNLVAHLGPNWCNTGFLGVYVWRPAAFQMVATRQDIVDQMLLAYSPEKSLVSMVWLDSDQRIWHHWRKNGSKVRVNRKHLKKKKKHHEQHTSQAKNKVSVPNFCQKQPEDHTKILWRNIRISHCDADVFPTDVSPVVRCAFWRPHSLE